MKVNLEDIHPQNSAVIVIDVQNDYCHPEGAMSHAGRDLSRIDAAVDRISLFIDQARGLKVPVMFIAMQNDFWTDSPTWLERKPMLAEVATCQQGTWGGKLYRLCPQDGDLVLEKNRYSAFVGTKLDLILKGRGFKNLVFCGFATNVCVESSVRDAIQSNYRTITLRDCTGAYFADEYEASLKVIGKYFGSVMSSEEVLNLWRDNLKK